MKQHISTKRLQLDLLSEEDHAFIMQLVNSKGWIEFIGDRNVYTKQDAIAYTKRIMAMENLFYWVVKTKDDQIPIGIISFLKRAYLEHFDIGFAFLPEFSGCGYAYEAAKEVYDIASSQAAYHTILATTIPRNINSIKLLNKLGMHFEKEIEVGADVLHVYSNMPS